MADELKRCFIHEEKSGHIYLLPPDNNDRSRKQEQERQKVGLHEKKKPHCFDFSS